MPTPAKKAPKKIIQLTPQEQQRIRQVIGNQGAPTQALNRINATRRSKDIRETDKSTVHRFCRGLTHKASAVEKRGRKRILSRADVRKLDNTRRRLIKKTKNEKMVKYGDSFITCPVSLLN